MADVTYRTGFGTGNYGVRVYGLDGTITEGISTVITSSSVAAASVRVRLSQTIIASTSGVVSDGQRVREVSATATPSASGSSVGAVYSANMSKPTLRSQGMSALR